MKSLFLFLFTLTFSTQALEIQCKTQWEETDLIIKTSESSQVTYLLFLKEDQLDKYWPLPDGSFSFQENIFTYQDEQTSLSILVNGEGKLESTPPLYNNESSIQLTNCLSF